LVTARAGLASRAGAAAALDRADERLAALVRLRRPGADVERTRAHAARLRAEWEWSQRRRAPAAQALSDGLARVEAALLLDPADGEAYGERGALLSLRAAMADDAAARALAHADARTAY